MATTNRQRVAAWLWKNCRRWLALASIVSQGEIEVILPGTDFRAVYYKRTGEPQLLAKGSPNGSHEFKAHAWWEACQMARQLGWLV